MASKSKKIPLLKSFVRSLLFIIAFLGLSSFHTPTYHYALARVVIDAGHGGHDTGCLGAKVKEKDVALAIALKLGKFIEINFPEVKVIYTRKTDVFVELHERAEIANNAKADLFICVHCNSACYHDQKKKKDVCNQEINGVETWVMGLHKSEANLEVSKRENDVVLLEKDYTKKYDGFDPNSPEANIIFSLYQNAYLDQSLRLASFVQNEVEKKGREERGVKQAGFLVLFKTYMPSVLVETGFLSCPSEEKYLSGTKGQNEIAESVFNAFKNYKASIESGETGKTQEKKIPAVESDNETEVRKEAKDSSVSKVDSSSPNQTPTDLIVKPQTSNPSSEPKYSGREKSTLPEPIIQKDVYEFAVQILSSPKKLERTTPRFKGIKEIHEEFENGLYKYTSQRSKNFDDVMQTLRKMKDTGFNDAFVVAYKLKKRITLKQAREEMMKGN